MNGKRLFAQTLLALSLTIICLSAVALGQSASSYDKLPVPRPVALPGKIEVIEFFSYGDLHSAAIEPLVEDWAKRLPSDVMFRREPLAWHSWMDFEAYAKLFFTLQLLGQQEKQHRAVFDTVHRGLQLSREETMLDWVAKRGIDRAKFQETYNSFALQMQLKSANKLSNDYSIQAPPTFIVNGKFSTSPSRAGGEREVFATIDQLIAQERSTKGRGARSSLGATEAAPRRKRVRLP